MAAPTLVAISTPSGLRLEDGFRTVMAFSGGSGLSLWETELAGGISLDGGDPIDITTMREVRYMIKAFHDLIDIPPFEYTGAYDPIVYNTFLSLLNVPQRGTVHISDGSTITFYCAISKFIVQGYKRREMPVATVTVVPSNYDHVNHVEAAPAIVLVAGT